MNMPSDTCDLCGLPLRYSNFRLDLSNQTFRFCCIGCRQVFTMLSEASDSPDPSSFRETELFKKCQDMGIIPRTEPDPDRKATEQEPEVLKTDSKGEAGETVDPAKISLGLHLNVSNMWCPSCAWLIEEVLKRNRGIVNAICNFSTDRLRCEYNPVLTSPAEIIRSVDNLGYKAAIPGEEAEPREGRREFIRFALSAFLTMNVMMLSFALYSGFFTEFTQETIYKLSWPIFVMASIVLFYGGRNIYKRAWAGVFSAAFGMETLITMGSFSAYLYSVFNLLSGSIHLYFDTASMLITLVLLGKTLEMKAKGKVHEGLESFFSLKPTKVRICADLYPEGRYMAAEQLRKGDLFRVQEEEVIPADGTILEGKGSVDESSLTGEALPIVRKPGERLMSGTKVIKGRFRVRAEGVHDESTLGQMIKIMERALEKKAPFEGKTDRFFRWFVPIVIGLALCTGLVCLLSGLSTGDAMVRAVTVMVVSCPCALGIAIPLARVAGISIAGEKGILVRDFSSFEEVERVNAFVLDKTGTITHGQWSLMEIIPFDPFSEAQALAMAASLEKDSDHYIATEIKKQAEKRSIQPANIKPVTIFENGISGKLGKNEIKIGSGDFLLKESGNLGDILKKESPAEGPEHSYVYMSFDGKACAVFVFGDQIRVNSHRVMEELSAMGYRITLISGDGQKTTNAVACRIGVMDAQGGKRPLDKAAFVNGLQEKGHRVAMVGDGINDAPALVQADLAIAIHSGSHLGKEAADITLMRSDPAQILDFLNLGKRVNRKIHQNLGCSFVYNIISLPIAMSGLLTPLIAVCAMLLSSLSVIGNTLLLIRKSDTS